MAKLVLSRGGTLLHEIPLVKGATTIGRNNDNDIPLDDQSASGHHAQVVKEDDQYIVEDLRSTNGTLVNAAKIERRSLGNNDVIAIGKHELRFVGDEVQPAAQIADFEKTVFIGMPTKAPAAPAAPTPPPQRPQAPAPTIAVASPTPAPSTGEGMMVKVLMGVVAVLAAAVVAYLYLKMRH